jgi:hypothetical protein
MRLLLAALLAVAALAAQADGPRLELDAEITWREGWDQFGGFSALAVAPDGERFLAVTDKARWVRGRFDRTADGALQAARTERRGRLHGVDGTGLSGTDSDAEGLALDADGRAYVSFEGFHRIRRFDRINGAATSVRGHPDFDELQVNSGIEALAIDAGGVLHAIPERSGALDRPFPVYRWDGERWDKSLRLRRDGSFLPVDADFGPDGRLYLLERDFKWLGGFATRVRRFTLGPNGVEGEVTLLRTPFGTLDNMEGLSVWQDAAGVTRVTLVSDDNFFPLQRTMFAEYRLVGD